jgi:hypothetical protein
VEFHVRASDWWTHGHDCDPRYNHVILHVVLIYDECRPTRRQDGVTIPVCSLNDLSLSSTGTHVLGERWPCQRLLAQLSLEEVDRLLLHAGLQRFEQKVQTCVVQIRAARTGVVGIVPNASSAVACVPCATGLRVGARHRTGASPVRPYSADPVPTGPYDLYDCCLLPSLAEGLAYGRDRELFRVLGLRLLGQHTPLPEPLGHTEQPAPLDASRLRVLARMLERWHPPGIWLTLRAIILSSLSSSEHDSTLNTIHTTLRTHFCELGLSVRRTDILVINVVLPFAAAVALLEQDTLLGERAQQLYLSSGPFNFPAET